MISFNLYVLLKSLQCLFHFQAQMKHMYPQTLTSRTRIETLLKTYLLSVFRRNLDIQILVYNRPHKTFDFYIVLCEVLSTKCNYKNVCFLIQSIVEKKVLLRKKVLILTLLCSFVAQDHFCTLVFSSYLSKINIQLTKPNYLVSLENFCSLLCIHFSLKTVSCFALG